VEVGDGRPSRDSINFRSRKMNWSDIKVGHDYIVKERTLENDDRKFIGFRVLKRETSENSNRTIRLAIGNLFTIDGSLSNVEVSLSQEALTGVWVRTEEQRAKEEAIRVEIERLKELLAGKSKDIVEQLKEAGVNASSTTYGVRIEADYVMREDQNKLALTLNDLDCLSEILNIYINRS